jgi:hypothetical protein
LDQIVIANGVMPVIARGDEQTVEKPSKGLFVRGSLAILELCRVGVGSVFFVRR